MCTLYNTGLPIGNDFLSQEADGTMKPGTGTLCRSETFRLRCHSSMMKPRIQKVGITQILFSRKIILVSTRNKGNNQTTFY